MIWQQTSGKTIKLCLFCFTYLFVVAFFCFTFCVGYRKIVHFIYINWQTNRLEHRLQTVPSTHFCWVLFWFHFFWAFRSRRVQCQKCQALVVFIYLFIFFIIHFFGFNFVLFFVLGSLIFGMRPARAFCQRLKPNCWQSFRGHLYWLCAAVCACCVYPANDFIVSWRAYVDLNCFYLSAIMCRHLEQPAATGFFFRLFFFVSALSAYAASIRLWSLWCHAKANSSSFLFYAFCARSGHIWTALFYFS